MMNVRGVAAVYCDGGCIYSNPSPYGGTYAFRLVDAAGNLVHASQGVIMCERDEVATNNLMELAALVQAVGCLPVNWRGEICSDSENALGRFFCGWKMRNIPDWLVEATLVERNRIDRAGCTPVLIHGHPTRAELAAGSVNGKRVSIHNVECDNQCKRLARVVLERLAAKGD